LNIEYAGNIGVPLIEFVGQSSACIVVELSSYQLETVVEFIPDVAIITNITPDHLERHGTMVAYAAAKAAVFRNQTSLHPLIYLEGDDWIEAIVADAPSQKWPLSISSPLVHAVAHRAETLQKQGRGRGLIGSHNHLNGAMAVAAACAMGISEPDALARLASYEPLEHRLEWVATVDGKSFFDDSKATNPDSTMVAVAAFHDPIHLILGGKDKGLDLDDFMRFLNDRVKTITVYGEIGDRVMAVAFAVHCSVPMAQTDTLDQATELAFNGAQSGDVILLSPACSSFDQFRDFNHRGDHFKSYVRTQIAHPTS
jgi:UDP-N-acetylmuramoylalanine--D-glutamate ligase